ncbi:hypothetical protein BTJ40_03175 [Microbulbifer sp. A4B17]|nr:hypothetical protein BTJ40_03175 [Microbulbifer sp. A4B17]
MMLLAFRAIHSQGVSVTSQEYPEISEQQHTAWIALISSQSGGRRSQLRIAAPAKGWPFVRAVPDICSLQEAQR